MLVGPAILIECASVLVPEVINAKRDDLMNGQFLKTISDLVFIERMNLFHSADVVLYHPGHFPELNEHISELYKNEGFKEIWIPDLHNQFLNENEYKFHSKLLVKQGIPAEIIRPITGEHKDVCDVVRNSMLLLDSSVRTILLAGKSFFCKRFLLLATLYSSQDKTIDVFPITDERGITKDSWFLSVKGIDRVLNEVKAIGEILERSKEMIRGLQQMKEVAE